MKLYQHPMSSNARRAVMTTLELGVAVELVLVDLAKGEQRHPNFIAKNLAGKVPVLEDDGFYLSESNAIMLYVAEKTHGQTLYPSALRERADVNRWMFWSAHHLAPTVGLLNWEHFVKGFRGLGGADETVVARGEAMVIEAGRVLDTHLANREWVALDRFTLADIALATPFMHLESAKLPVRDFPCLLGWLERMRARDSWQKTEPRL